MRLVSLPAVVGLPSCDVTHAGTSARFSEVATQMFPGPPYFDTNAAILQLSAKCTSQFLRKEATLELLCLPLKDPSIDDYGTYLPMDICLWFNGYPLKHPDKKESRRVKNVSLNLADFPFQIGETNTIGVRTSITMWNVLILHYMVRIIFWVSLSLFDASHL